MTKPLWRARLLPLFLALLGLNALVFALWTLPRSLRQRSAAARAESARAELARERELNSALAARAQAIKANRADLERFYASLAGSERQDLAKTLEAVEALVQAPGLQTRSRMLRREELGGAPLERVTIALPLEGSYSQLVGFLREVESAPQFLTVDKVALRSDGESGGSLQVELSTYLRQPPEARKGRSRAR